MSKTSQRRRDDSFRAKKCYEAGRNGMNLPFPSVNSKEYQNWKRGYRDFLWRR